MKMNQSDDKLEKEEEIENKKQDIASASRMASTKEAYEK